MLQNLLPQVPMKTYLLLVAIACLLFASCKKDERQAQQSLQGKWKVTAIESNYGDFSEGGYAVDTSISESGKLGTFNFSEDQVDYEFTRRDTLYSGSRAWQLRAEKVNDGFVRVLQFTLTVENEFTFDVQFEDATKNSEKKAKTAIFWEQPSTASNVLVTLWLEKA